MKAKTSLLFIIALPCLAVALPQAAGRSLAPTAYHLSQHSKIGIPPGHTGSSFHVKAQDAPPWAVPFGMEFWRNGAMAPSHSTARATCAVNVAATTPNLNEVMDRVAHAFQWCPDQGNAILNAAAYDARVTPRELQFTSKSDGSAGLTLRILAFERGGDRLYDPGRENREWSVLGNTAQVLLNRDQGIVAHYLATRVGVELTWVLRQALPGTGDLEIALGFDGLSYAATTRTGHHFNDHQGVARVRIGRTWVVDATGQKTEADVALDSEGAHLRVSAATLRDSHYPLAIDPTISAEFGVDEPVWSERAGGIIISISTAVAAGAGSYLVVWQHYSFTAGRWDVFGSRVSFGGQVLDPAGILITPPSGVRAPGEYSNDVLVPAVAWDGQNFLVLWEDPRDVWTYAVYGARVSAAGQVLDPDGIVIGRGPVREGGPGFLYMGRSALAWNGQNYLAVWEHSDAPFGISGKRVTAAGVVVDSSPIAISTSDNAETFPAIAWDSKNFVVAWKAVDGFFAARVNGDGAVLDPSGIAVSDERDRQSLFALSSSGTGSLVVWGDRREASSGPFSRIYGTRLDLDGQVLDRGGFPISEGRGADPAVAWNGANYQVVWSTDDFLSNLDERWHNSVHGARVSVAGEVLDPEEVEISPASDYAGRPAVASNGINSLVAWCGRKAQGWITTQPVHAARLGLNGRLEDEQITAMTSGRNAEYSPAVAFNGSNYLVVWSDDRNGTPSIYGARVGSGGQMLDPAGIAIGVTGWYSSSPAVASNGQDYFVVWEASTRYDYKVLAAGVSAAGALLNSQPVEFAVTGEYPKIAWGGAGTYLVVYTQLSSFPGIFAKRVSPDGQIQDSTPIRIDASSRLPQLASNGHGYLVVWESGLGFVWSAAVTREGVVQSSGPISSYPSGATVSATVASNGENYLVAWSSFQDRSFADITTAELSPARTVLALTKVDTQPAWQYGPAAAWDGRQYLLAWTYNDSIPTDDGGVTYGAIRQVRGLRLDRHGRALDSSSLILASPENTSPLQAVGVACGLPAECLLTYATVDADLGVMRVKGRIVKNDDLSPPVPPAAGDFNADGRIDSADLNILLGQIRARSTDLTYDMNGDGTVSIADARFLVLHFSNPSQP